MKTNDGKYHVLVAVAYGVPERWTGEWSDVGQSEWFGDANNYAKTLRCSDGGCIKIVGPAGNAGTETGEWIVCGSPPAPGTKVAV
jgi:hypothetical protein